MVDPGQRRYLVTGAQGFIATALCCSLQARGHLVRAVIRHPGQGHWDESIHCDLGAKPLPAELMDGVDGVFHLAGIAHVQDIAGVPDAVYQRINVDATSALLDSAARRGVKGFVYFSSIKAAADPGPHCVDESWDAAPSDAYGRSKREAEQRVLAVGRATGMHVCNLRPCLVYGPGVKGNLARMIDAIERGVFPPLPEFNNRRSMVGLNDLIEAAWLAMNRREANGRTYIVSDGEPYSTRALFVAISRALGKPVPGWSIPSVVLRAGAAAGDLAARITDRPMPFSSAVLDRLRGSACYRSEQIRRQLGWQPRQTFADALPAIIAARPSPRPSGRPSGPSAH
jgi:UDP-glucose 4-epimerase